MNSKAQQDFKIYFPQKTQNTKKYTDSHITGQNTIKSFSNTANSTDNIWMTEHTSLASHIRKEVI